MAAAGVPKLYRSVIEDVINGVKDVFLDEGVDEQALLELRQIWEKKLLESKAIDPPDHPVPATAGRQQATTATLQPTPQAILEKIPRRNPAFAATAQPLTIGPNGLMQPTLVQYHTPIRGPGLVDQKLIITQPGQTATVMSSSAAAAALALHPDVAASLLQGGVINMGDRQTANPGAQLQFHPVVTLAGEHYTTTTATGQVCPNRTVSLPFAMPAQVVTAAAAQSGLGNVVQLDGARDTSDEDEDEDEFNEDEEEGNEDGPQDDENEDGPQEEVEPLNSDDDVSDEEATENFEIDNVVVCQYDKISRSRNRWKFHFKDGIMNLQGKDYVFQKAVGDAEW
ncbi:transcription initiation factor IIA subunit 1 isoform X1 [Rhipicephalus sanguineus]|uniref:transcription initiation factor IIA subunit 1 isoform X1 n=1 Tax=Rhipicephalus sanguineus TaxID=34632 RepID=UPI001895B653|nr:transcription initiation factor IIA subunit 1 isoform X1 [Rhipicephalus sanguineus]